MKIQFLGTAAAEAWPALFCECDNCRRAEEAGGRNIRTRSQAVIDDTILIDFPPDTCAHVLYGGLQLRKIHSCIITHGHNDHLYVNDFRLRKGSFAHLKDETPFTVFGTPPTINKLNDLADKNIIKTITVEPFVPFEIEGYTVTPLAASHDAATNPVIYLISKGGKTLLYGHDTGYFPDSTWDWLANNRPRLDLVSLDCTVGLVKGWRDHHMGLDTDIEVVQRLRSLGVVHEDTILVVNHFSHNCNATYDEMVPVAQKLGFVVSYDGMIVNI